MSSDVRSVANYVLDWASAQGRGVTNLEINKIVFFLHAHHLVELGTPLVSAKIEAWDYGPVFRELYSQFKSYENSPITDRATKIDPESGTRVVCKETFGASTQHLIESLLPKYVRLSASALVSLSHEVGGPWDKVWNRNGGVNPSMKISDESIRDWFAKTARH